MWIRSDQVMTGYWRNPEATAEAIDADGWFRSGDAGYVRDGRLYLHDRVKDMIVSGAENIYPAEVENMLMSHPGVAEVAVIGVPHERWGETVKAIVVRASRCQVTEAEIIAHARANLAHYKCPTSVEFVVELPRNATGKILKRELREPLLAGATTAASAEPHRQRRRIRRRRAGRLGHGSARHETGRGYHSRNAHGARNGRHWPSGSRSRSSTANVTAGWTPSDA